MARKKQSKFSKILTAIVCFVLGAAIGVFGNIFFTMPDSYEIPDAVTGSSYDMAVGNLSVQEIKSKELSIHFLELGNKYTGDCTFIKVGDVEVLIDAGSKADSIPVIQNYISRYVEGDLDYVIVTHAHEDHYAGFATSESTQSLFDLFTVGTVIDFQQTNKSTSNKMYANYLRELNQTITEKQTKHFKAFDCYEAGGRNSDGSAAARVYDLGNGVELEILYQKFYEEHATTENDYSVCVMINQGEDKHYLFTGDLEKEGERSLADPDNNELPEVDVYKAGHHGSKTSSCAELLEVIKPKIVCVCCCAGSSEYTAKNENQFPTQEFVNNVFKYTTNVYVTTLCENYQENKFTSMNGNIVVFANATTNVSVSCSNNNTVLKDTDWFKKNRTMPNVA